MHRADLGALTHALAFRHLLRVGQPLVFEPQARQRRTGQRIECGVASAAAIALQPRCQAPARDLLVATMRTDWCRSHAAFNQAPHRLRMSRRTQPIRQNLFLMRRQLLQLRRQPSKFFRFHGNTYPVDLPEVRIDQYLTVTWPFFKQFPQSQ